MKKAKRFLSLMLAMVLALSITACGGKEQSVTMVYEEAGVTMEMTYEAQGDIVQTMIQKSKIDCSMYSEEDLDVIEASAAAAEEAYQEYDAVDYSLEIDGDMMIEVITIDVSDADQLQSLADAGLIPLTGEGSRISLQKTIAEMEKQGFVVQ